MMDPAAAQSSTSSPNDDKDSTSDMLLDLLSDYVDGHMPLYIERLREAVAIESVSSDPSKHSEILKMMNYAKIEAEKLGGICELMENPCNEVDKGKSLPPILLSEFKAGSDSEKKKTVCVYGHLDVQPAAKEDGWDTDPFVLTEKDGKLFGRGSTDDKGPALSWLWVIEAYQALNIPLPVNVKLIFEGLEEFGSEGMFEAVQMLSKADQFLDDVDYFCISDNYWLGKRVPCLTYGLRGLASFEVRVTCARQDLHSGVLGGVMHEGMVDLVHLMSSLVDSNGKILVEGVMDDVVEVTPEEEALYTDIDFDIEEFKKESGVKDISDALLHDNKKDLLMARWRYPTLSLHGIEGAFSGPGGKTVIPANIAGKFSLRLVPDQDPAQIAKLVESHLNEKFTELGSPNKMEVVYHGGAKAWLSNPKHPNYKAGARAIQKVFGMTPNYTREGGSIPITTWLEDATQMNVLLLPIGACDDMAHSQNEKYNISNMRNGVKVLGVYLNELGMLSGPKPSRCRCVPLTEEELMVPGAFIRGFRCKCEM